MTQKFFDEMLRLHEMWLNGEEGGKRADMRGADMRRADMRRADMRCADMRGADIDYSAWPLWCGSLQAFVDDRIAIQLLYHTLSVVMYSPYVSRDVKRTLLTQDVVDVANMFHHVFDCGKLKTWEEIKGEA